MKQKVFIIHTSFVSVEELTRMFHKSAPDVELRHIVDDSLLAEVLTHGGVTPAVRRRICDYYKAAQRAGADLIFNQCSSVGEAADFAAKRVRVPVIKVDQQMARVACKTGVMIGVVATLETTLGPTCRLIQSTARELGREVRIECCLVSGAFEALVAGDRKRHNRMVVAAIRKLAGKVDVVACAQGSMTAILPQLGKTKVPVLTSPASGVQAAVKFLRQLKDGRSPLRLNNAKHSRNSEPKRSQFHCSHAAGAASF